MVSQNNKSIRKLIAVLFGAAVCFIFEFPQSTNTKGSRR
jgi:hypothetical protein